MTTVRVPYVSRMLMSVLLVVGLAGRGASLHAQVPAGTLNITVHDATGAAVSGVSLTLTGPAVVRTATSGGTGTAVFAAVPPGVYEVLAARPGFASVVLRAVTVREGDTLALVVTLAVSPVSEFVDVPAPGRYAVAAANTATKTDVPLLETPVSVQVVPQAVIIDRQATSLPGAVDGQVSGVVGRTGGGILYDNFIIRGLPGSDFGDAYRNGLYNRQDIYDIANIERVEVLKGPAAVLYGRIEPGGLINYVTKRPLATRRYAVEQQAGSFQQFRTLVDATGPVAGQASLLYRFNGSFYAAESFRDYVSNERLLIAPSLTWKPGDRFDITVDLEHKRDRFQPDIGIPSIGNRPAPLPVERSVSDGARTQPLRNTLVAFNWTYRLNSHWSLTQRFQRQDWSLDSEQILASSLQANNQFQNRWILKSNQDVDTTSTNLDLQGRFQTGAVGHRVLVGVDHFRARTESPQFFGAAPPLDIFQPVYGQVRWDTIAPTYAFYRKESWTGVYVQDQLTLTNRWQVLLGGRFDFVSTGATSGVDLAAARNALQKLEDEQFSPRVALLYRLHPMLSAYTSYARSFSGNNGRSATDEPFDPQQGLQYEVGVKGEARDGRLTSTVAWFHLTKDNLLTADPLNPQFQVLAGEARSTGLEADVAGQLTPRLTLLATYAHTNARNTKNNDGLEGKWLENVPRNQGSLWGTFDIDGGLRLGLGAVVVGERQGDLANTVQLEAYRRVDAMAAYARPLGRSVLTLQLNVNNLFDAAYFTNGGSRGQNFPGRPRNVLASARVVF